MGRAVKRADRDGYRQGAIDGVYFEPWVRENYYHSCWGLRVLIVSESHYEHDPERRARGELIPRDETQKIMYRRATEETRRAHTTKIATSFLGHRPVHNGGEMWDFWNSVAFYNFVQEGMSGPYERPNGDAFTRSIPGFYTVLSMLKPQFVAVFWLQSLGRTRRSPPSGNRANLQH